VTVLVASLQRSDDLLCEGRCSPSFQFPPFAEWVFFFFLLHVAPPPFFFPFFCCAPFFSRDFYPGCDSCEKWCFPPRVFPPLFSYHFFGGSFFQKFLNFAIPDFLSFFFFCGQWLGLGTGASITGHHHFLLLNVLFSFVLPFLLFYFYPTRMSQSSFLLDPLPPVFFESVWWKTNSAL